MVIHSIMKENNKNITIYFDIQQNRGENNIFIILYDNKVKIQKLNIGSKVIVIILKKCDNTK